MDAHELILEGNAEASAPPPRRAELKDEKLRDGLQCPTVRDPAVHGTAVGIGERCGNTEMDLLHLRLMGLRQHEISRVPDYIALAARALGASVAHNWAVFGEDAFRPGSGAHAAALVRRRAREMPGSRSGSTPGCPPARSAAASASRSPR